MSNLVNIEAEGKELIIENEFGDVVIIPKNKSEWVKKMLDQGCYDCIDGLVATLPSMKDFAEEGGIISSDENPFGSLKKDRRWLENWYKKRKIYGDDVRDNDFYNDNIKPLYLAELKKKTPVEINFDRDGSHGYYDSEQNKIYISPTAPKDTYLHELTHKSMRDFDDGLNNYYVEQNKAEYQSPPLVYSNEILDEHKEMYDYLTIPTEMHARLMQLRRQAGFKPNKRVTEKDIQKFIDSYDGGNQGINELFNTTKGLQGVLNLLNGMADNSMKDFAEDKNIS